MSFFYYLVLFSFLFLCAVLTFVILIQESKTMGLGASFGGGDSSDSLFGTSTADVLKKFTAYLTVVFMVSCLLLSIWTTSLGAPKRSEVFDVEEVSQ